MGTIRKIEREKKGVAYAVYEAAIAMKGAPRRSKSFPTRKKAKEWITESEAKLNKGGKISSKALHTSLVSEILTNYLEEHKIGVDEKTEKPIYKDITESKIYNIPFLAHHLQGVSIEMFTHEIIQKFVYKMSALTIKPHPRKKKASKLYNGEEPKKLAGTTVRRHFYNLNSILRAWSHKTGYELNTRFQDIKLPASWIPRDRILTGEELKRFFEACSKMKDPIYWELYVKFALETAMRPSEQLQLTWGNVFLEHEKRFAIVRAHTNKMKIERQVPLSKKALDILNKLKKIQVVTPNDLRVFSRVPHDEFSKGFKTICFNAGIQGARAHDLRHMALTNFFEKNINLSVVEIAAIAGHKQISTLQRYVNLRANILADKLDQTTS